MKLNALFLSASLLAFSPALAAQTTTTQKVVTAEVVAVHGNKLIYKMDGVVKEAEIPASVRFDVGGKKLALSELEAGTTVTATIATKTTVVPGEKIVTIKNGKVLHVQGNTVIAQTEDQVIKKHVIPSDFPIIVDGKKTTVHKLKKGMTFSATWVTQAPSTIVTEKEIAEASAKMPEKPAPAETPAPVAKAAPAKLPKTGGHLQLLGLLGLLSLGAGAGLRRLRPRS